MKRSLLLLCCFSLLASLQANAQSNQTIYTDALTNSWTNMSTSSTSFSSTAYVHSGTRSIKVTYTAANQALYLNHAAFASAAYTSVSFWINGGKASGQSMNVVAVVNGVVQTPVPLNTYISGGSVGKGVWSQATVPLADLGASQANLTGIQLQNTAGRSQTAFYLDDVTLIAAQAVAPPPPPTGLTVTGVASNLDSIKVRYNPVPGAKDYRIYDITTPTKVKYAGVLHMLAPYNHHFVTDSAGNPVIPDKIVANTATANTPTVIDVLATEIEMNGLTPGTSYTFVVEAVNALGPVCQGSLYDALNNPLYVKLCDMCSLGANMGCTGDGNVTTNGQGGKDNKPTAIASATIKATPTGQSALPSSSGASQALFDTFDSGTITPVGKLDAAAGIETFTLQTPAANWEIRTENVDTTNSQVFIMSKHFMDILFDGGTPGTNSPLHQGHGVISLSPKQTVDFTGGKILHLTQEVDTHNGSRRWIDFRLVPANDPYLALETNNRINNTNTDVMIQIFGNIITLDQHTGNATPGDPNSPPLGTRIVGALGQGLFADGDRPCWASNGLATGGYWSGTAGYQQGRGLDDRSRLDMFVSKTHFAVYEDGVKISEHDFTTPLPFEAAKVYFSHYHYHTALELQELKQYAPWETYWINSFPYSDERHWDNMGYEVLPATTNWTTLNTIVQPPVFH